VRKSGRERARVSFDTSPRRSTIGDHKERPHARRAPSTRGSESFTTANLAIEWREQSLDVRHHRLGLHNKYGGGRRVPGQDVNGAPLTIECESDLGNCLPPSTPQNSDNLLDKCSVARIEESVGGLAMPVDAEHHPSVECSNHAVDGVDADAAGPAAFDAGDERLRNTGSGRQVELTPSLPDPECPDDSANPHDVHARSVAVEPYRGVIRALG
jgi:hypothetical protein